MTDSAALYLPTDWRDFLSLTKPRVMSLVIFTGLCGLLAAPGYIHPLIGFTAVLCIAMGAGGACMLVGEDAFVMLLGREKFAEFSKLPTADPTTHALALYCFAVSSRDEVDAVFDAALAAGATDHDDTEDHGFMYTRSFVDLDGHPWQVMWMDAAAAQQGNEGADSETLLS